MLSVDQDRVLCMAIETEENKNFTITSRKKKKEMRDYITLS